jgi:phenylpyruvate tautomerase PptA (4-oxalocrotonate tautomerase family)
MILGKRLAGKGMPIVTLERVAGPILEHEPALVVAVTNAFTGIAGSWPEAARAILHSTHPENYSSGDKLFSEQDELPSTIGSDTAEGDNGT